VSRDLVRWATIAIPIGIVAGLGAAAFYELWLESTNFFLNFIVGVNTPLPVSSASDIVVWGSSFPRILLLPLVMGLGGLSAGYLAERFAPEIAGHGTDQAIRAFHFGEGRIRARVPILKTIASALTLGTGGSGGREGPTAQIGAGFGSWWAGVLGLSDHERRIALATGLGAGVGAIFRAPLGGAIYSAEIFYTGDFEPEVFVPAIISSVVSYSIFGSIYGFNTLFATPVGIGWTPVQIPLYALLGVTCAAAGVAFVLMFRGVNGWFLRRKLRLPLRAALGALLASACILAVYIALPSEGHFASLAALNVGYGFVQAAMLGQVGLFAFAPLALLTIGVALVLRMVASSLTVGSGGSAGLFGTSVVVGALVGVVIGGFFHWLSPGLVPTPDVAAFVIVGMMAFFGGISKAPLAVLVMVVEMAGGYSLLLPAMLAIFLAYVLTGNHLLYPDQIPNRFRSPAHREEFRQSILGEMPVGSLGRSERAFFTPDVPVREALQVASRSDQTVFGVVDGEHWLGFVRVRDLLEIPEALYGERKVVDVVHPFQLTIREDLSSTEALEMMEKAGAEVAALLSTGSVVQIRGLVTRSGLLQTRAPAGRAPLESSPDAPS
jgi:chloride channel protein, CIC family